MHLHLCCVVYVPPQFCVGLDDDESRWEAGMRDHVIQAVPFHLACWMRADARNNCPGL